MTIRIPATLRNALTDLVVDAIDAGAGAGSVRIYTGTQPATADTAASGTLLATVALADPAFGASASGLATATDPAPVNPSGTGTAGWFRVVDSNAVTVMDGSVTATGGGGDMTLSNTSLAPGINVDITSFTYNNAA